MHTVSRSLKAVSLCGVFPLRTPEKGTGLLAMPAWTAASSHSRQASHFPQVLARLPTHQIFYSSFKCSWTALDIPCNQTKTSRCLWHISHHHAPFRHSASCSHVHTHDFLVSSLRQLTQRLLRVTDLFSRFFYFPYFLQFTVFTSWPQGGFPWGTKLLLWGSGALKDSRGSRQKRISNVSN